MPAPPEGSVPAMERTLGTLRVPTAVFVAGVLVRTVGCSAIIDNPFASSN